MQIAAQIVIVAIVFANGKKGLSGMKKLVIETEKLAENIQNIKQYCGENTVIAVVKGDGYGLSLIPYATFLLQHEITHFAVSEAEEALTLKENETFSSARVLLMTPQNDPETVRRLIQHGVTLTVGDLSHAELIRTICEEENLSASVHLKVDTGFGRFGFDDRNKEQILTAFRNHGSHYLVEGIFTHYSCAFEKKYTYTKRQDERFDAVLSLLLQENPDLYNTLLIHSANSCGALLYPNPNRNGVRIGSAFLGRLPMKSPVSLHRIAYLETVVLDTKYIKKGDNIAYGNTYRAKEDMQTAVIGIGYKDGFGTTKQNDAFRLIDILRYVYADLRSIGKKTYLYRGTYEILGRVGMYCAIVKNNGTLKPNDTVKVDCNPLFIDSAIVREYR